MMETGQSKLKLKLKLKKDNDPEETEKIVIENCDLSSLLGSLYTLNESQILLFSKILKYPNICIHYLEFMTDLKNNAIQKNLKVLLDKGLIERESVSLAEFKERCINQEQGGFHLPLDIKNDRGYLFLYKPKPINYLLKDFGMHLKYIEEQIEKFKNMFTKEV